MDSLRVPKRNASIEAVLFDGMQRNLEVFLADSSALHSGGERVADLLMVEGAFIPALDPATGRVSWLNTANVVLFRTSAKLESESDGDAIPTEHEVEVVLSTGVKLRALVSYVRPDDQARLTDFLNDAKPFLRLLDGEKVVFVNKRHVVCVMADG
jgi:hypothetical protein